MPLKSFIKLNIHFSTFRYTEIVPLEFGARGYFRKSLCFGYSVIKKYFVKLLASVYFPRTEIRWI